MKPRFIVVAAVIGVVAFASSRPAAAQHAQHYVLDAFGGVHAGGGAPLISPGTPYFGFDVATDIEFIPVGTAAATGDGILVLDKFGGVHKGGALAADPPSGSTPYFGFDAARAIVYRDIPPRAEGNATNLNQTLSSTTYAVIRTESIRAPDDGFMLVVASAAVFCNASTGSTTAQLSLNVDSVGPHPDLDAYYAGFPDCSTVPPGVSVPIQVVSITKLFPVSAGNHTINLLGRRAAGATVAGVSGQSIAAVFIDQDGIGGS